jgi:hypothetical protein
MTLETDMEIPASGRRVSARRPDPPLRYLLRMIHHMVLLRFHTDVSPEALAEIFMALNGLRHSIPGLLSFAGGPYASPEGMNRGFTHGFAMTFTDAAARDDYLPHPAHERVKARILPLLEGGLDGVVAFDFEA